MCAVLCCVVCMCVLEKKQNNEQTKPNKQKEKQLTVVGAKREAGLRRTEKEKQTLEEGDQ